MKKFIKFSLVNLLTLISVVGLFAFNVSAATVTVSGGSYNVGQTVTVTVNIGNDTPITAAQTTVTYNSSVLTLKSISNVSSSDYTNNNGTVKIVDDNFSTADKDVTKGSYKLTFTAAAAGNSSIIASVSAVDKNLSKSTSQASAEVVVTTPKPSSNANLASIKISNGTLSPAFNAKTTNYSVTVKYDVDAITISGSVVDGGATYAGGGTFGLQVGDNQRVLTVTAADGTKKTYTVNIKRMSEQETADAEQAARDANPLLVIIDGVDYTISNDLAGVTLPVGFTQGTATRKESEITVLNDDGGKYQLCWLLSADGVGAWYVRDENDNFTRLVYVAVNDKFYIVEELAEFETLPEGYEFSERTVDGFTLKAIAYTDENLSDFYILNCYTSGSSAYYRLDTLEGTMQRAADFDSALELMNKEPEPVQKQSFWQSFKDLSLYGIILFAIIGLVIATVIALIVIVIVKIVSSKSKKTFDESDGIMAIDNAFDLNAFDNNFKPFDDNNTDSENSVETVETVNGSEQE